jgi:O-methyltransferase/aklanonic acid methyltransferase
MNVDSQEYKEWLTDIFDRSSEEYGQIGPQFIAHFGNKLVEYANIHEGAAVLDIACGRGASLFPAFEKVKPSGKVIGIDLSPEMLAETRKELDQRNTDGIRVIKMDAEQLLFPSESFDFVLCGLALFFFPHIDQALSEIYRVLKPRGVLVSSTFGEEDQRWDVFDELVASYQDELKAVPQAETSKLNTSSEIIETLGKAGFAEIEIFIEEKEFYYHDADEWWSSRWSYGSRALLERLEAKVLESFKREAFQLARGIEDEKGIPALIQVLITKAR